MARSVLQLSVGTLLCLTGAVAGAQEAPTEPLEAQPQAPVAPAEMAPPTEAMDPGPPTEEVLESAPCSELEVVRALGGEVARADLERCGLSRGSKTPAASPPPVPAAASAERHVVVYLVGGQELRGLLLAETDAELMVLLPGGETITLPLGAVREVRDLKEQDLPNARGWPRDKNRSRYLYAPSAMMLPKGSGHFSQRELVFSSLSYGVHDHLALQFGAVIPAWFGDPPDTLHGIIGLKTGWELTPGVHAGGGFQFFTLPAENFLTVGLLFGVVTLGDADGHISLAAGVPWARFEGDFDVGRTGMFVLSGALRLNRVLALVTENWWISVPGESETAGVLLDALAIRFVGSTFSADVGFIGVNFFDEHGFDEGLPVPIPWLDFTYHFGH